MPRRPSGELMLFEKHNVGASSVSQMVRDGRANDSAADDDDTGAGGERSHGSAIGA